MRRHESLSILPIGITDEEEETYYSKRRSRYNLIYILYTLEG